MSYYDRVILRLLYYISRIFAILEFRFDFVEKKFLKSRVGFYYVLIWHLVLITPFFILFSCTSFILLDFKHITRVLGICSAHTLSISTIYSIWNLLLNREKLLNLLQNFLKLADMHHQVFGKALQLAAFSTLFSFLRIYYVIAENSNGLMYHVFRMAWQVFLINFAMMLQFQLLKTLSQRMNSFPPTKEEKRKLYIEYIVELINLRQKLQSFLWPIFIYILLTEVCSILSPAIELYWEPYRKWLCLIVIKRLFFSNGLRMLIIARGINRKEVKILNRLYEREFYDIVLNSKTKKTINLIKVSCTSYLIFSNAFNSTVGTNPPQKLHYQGENSHPLQLYVLKTLCRFGIHGFCNKTLDSSVKF